MSASVLVTVLGVFCSFPVDGHKHHEFNEEKWEFRSDNYGAVWVVTLKQDRSKSYMFPVAQCAVVKKMIGHTE